MQYTSEYRSPLGRILLAADETGLTGLWFEGAKYYGRGLEPEHEEKELPVFAGVREWLDIYFSGRKPDFTPPVHMIGTDFQKNIWEVLLGIPYGETATYGEVAEKIAREKGVGRVSARAVGGAVGHNPVSLIIPCHRVVGADGSLTGYAGGLERKNKLLGLERGESSQNIIRYLDKTP